jgi:hypothetical protein
MVSTRERILHPVAVMRVQIQIHDVIEPEIEPGQQRQHGVVEVAEAARPVPPAVMGAAAGAMHDAAPRHQPRRQHRAAGRGRGPAIHLAIDRVAVGADAEPLAILGGDGLPRLRPLQGGEIVGIVEAGDLRIGRERRLHIATGIEPAHRADQIGAGGDAGDRERMAGTIGRAAIDLAADIDRSLAWIGEHGPAYAPAPDERNCFPAILLL